MISARIGASGLPASLAASLLVCADATLAQSALTTPAQSAPTTPAAAVIGKTDLQTIAEQTGFRTTGRYEEVERLCEAYAQNWPRIVQCREFGETPEGRRMLALVITRTGATTGQAASERGVPVMLVQGGIHAGEIEGKDAGFIAVRELLESKAPGVLDSIVIVFVPVFNVDGHERFGKWNRPNQNGPEEMGWRTTAHNLNLNRDYTKADAPEMRAMLQLLASWDPILYVDLHATNGAQFEHDVANIVEPTYAGDPVLHRAGRRLVKDLNSQLARQGSLPLDFYPSFVERDNPESGFETGPYPPRFSTGYWALRNRFAVLVETHSWKDYPTRVRITRNAVMTLADMTARQGASWLALAREADDRARGLYGKDVTIDYEIEPQSKMIDFRGYAYTREPSSISGVTAIRYDTTSPQIWRIPLRDQVKPKLIVRAPRGGYVVPPAYVDLVSERLALHDIRFGELDATAVAYPTEVFRASKVEFSQKPSEGRMTARIEGGWQEEKRDLPAGSLYVPIAQPKIRLILALLEPQSADSLVAWGFFNTAFEAKEYMENYVAEQVAQEMLESDPAVAAEFKRRLVEDPEFASDPAARLEFFYRRHPSWDERRDLYPIYRVTTAP